MQVGDCNKSIFTKMKVCSTLVRRERANNGIGACKRGMCSTTIVPFLTNSRERVSPNKVLVIRGPLYDIFKCTSSLEGQTSALSGMGSGVLDVCMRTAKLSGSRLSSLVSGRARVAPRRTISRKLTAKVVSFKVAGDTGGITGCRTVIGSTGVTDTKLVGCVRLSGISEGRAGVTSGIMFGSARRLHGTCPTLMRRVRGTTGATNAATISRTMGTRERHVVTLSTLGSNSRTIGGVISRTGDRNGATSRVSFCMSAVGRTGPGSTRASGCISRTVRSFTGSKTSKMGPMPRRTRGGGDRSGRYRRVDGTFNIIVGKRGW